MYRKWSPLAYPLPPMVRRDHQRYILIQNGGLLQKNSGYTPITLSVLCYNSTASFFPWSHLYWSFSVVGFWATPGGAKGLFLAMCSEGHMRYRGLDWTWLCTGQESWPLLSLQPLRFTPERNGLSYSSGAWSVAMPTVLWTEYSKHDPHTNKNALVCVWHTCHIKKLGMSYGSNMYKGGSISVHHCRKEK